MRDNFLFLLCIVLTVTPIIMAVVLIVKGLYDILDCLEEIRDILNIIWKR